MEIKELITKKIICKNCGSEAVVKFGNYKGVPRYYCKAIIAGTIRRSETWRRLMSYMAGEKKF